MLKRIFFPLTLLLCLVVATASCRDDDDELIDLPDELVSGPIRISVPENPWRIKRAADYYALYVECQGSGWIATCESEWLTLTPTEGSESQYIRFDVEENTEPFARVAVITITDAKEPDTYRVQVRIRQSGYNDEDNATLTGDMQKRHRMGYGYDIMKEYASDGSYSDAPILDYDKVVEAEESKGITIISEDRRHYQDLEIFSGTTITELAGQLTKEMDSKATFLGCGKVSDTKTDIYRNKTIEEVCGLVRLKQIISSRTVDVGMLRSQATSDDSPLYSKEFRNALKTINENNAKSLFAKFGTHLVVSADLGGSLELHTTITRETSIETQHSVTTVTKKVFGKNKGSSSQAYDSYQAQIGIDYKADLTCVGGDPKTHGTMQAAVNAKRQITPDEIKTWQASFNIDPSDAGKNYNVGMIGCRLIPIYEIINDSQKREWVQAAFAKYTNNPAMAPEPPKSPGKVVVTDIYNEWRKWGSRGCLVAHSGDCKYVIAKEYVPAIRRDSTVIVVYPHINNKICCYNGVFIGDAEHRPGVVRWLGNNCLYEPNDSVEYSNSKFAHLFNQNKSLKQLYFYYDAVQIMPPKQNNEYMADSNIQRCWLTQPGGSGFLEDSNVYIKIGSAIWDFTGACSKEVTLSNGSRFRDYVSYHVRSCMAAEYYCVAYAYYDRDPDSRDFWEKRIPNSNKYQTYGIRIPTLSDIENLLKICNGNLGMLFDFDNFAPDFYEEHYGSNKLGLKWIKGCCLSYMEHKDVEAIVIPTYVPASPPGTATIKITRITPSGGINHMTLSDYLKIILDKNKAYFFIYLVVDKFY